MDSFNDYLIQVQSDDGRWDIKDQIHGAELKALEEVERLRILYPDVAVRVVAV